MTRVDPFRIAVVMMCASFGFVGCMPQSPPQAILPSPAKTPTKQIDNADFVSWSRFPVGTKVVREKLMENSVGKTVVTTTLVLTEVLEDAVTVESQITVNRTSDTTTNPPDVVRIPAKHLIPESMNEASFSYPVPDAKPIGSESVSVLGKSFAATTYNWKTQLESGPMPCKGWFSDEFPGRQIRIDFGDENQSGKFSETVIALEIPDKG